MKRLAGIMIGVMVAAFTLAQCAKPATTTPGTTTSVPAQTTTAPATTTTAKTTSAPATTTVRQTTPPAGPYGDLRYAVASFSMETWDPIKADGPNDSILLNQVYDWFFRMEAGKLVPSVIEKWDIAPDGLSWTFRVRQGIKFSDGTDLTAKDVKFSMDRYVSKDALYANMRNAVERTEVVDNYTVRAYTKGSQPFLPFYMTDITPAQGIVTPADYITKNGVEYFMKNPMGSGPWKVAKYTQGDSVQYTAKDSNWRKVPAFKTLSISLVPEPATQVAMLKAGDIDVTGVSLEDAVNLEKSGYTTYAMVAGQSRLQLHGALDPRAKALPVADVRVRQALTLAINQQEVSKTLFYGKALPMMPPRILFGQDDIDTDYWVKQVAQQQQYDPAKAKQLLAAAGYANGFSGIKLYVTPLPGMEYVDKLAQIVQSYWKAIGVNAEVQPLDLANLVAWRREPVDSFVGHATFGVTNLSPAISNFEFVYGSKGAAPLTARNTGKEITSFTPEMDKAIYSAITEINAAKRMALIAQAIKLGMDTYTVVTFGQVPAMMAVGPKVKFELKGPLEVAYAPQWADMALHR